MIKNKIDIKLIAPPLVKGDRGHNCLWRVSSYYNKEAVIYCTNTAYIQDILQDLAIYLHACDGYSIIKTWIAIDHGQNYLQLKDLDKE